VLFSVLRSLPLYLCLLWVFSYLLIKEQEVTGEIKFTLMNSVMFSLGLCSLPIGKGNSQIVWKKKKCQIKGARIVIYRFHSLFPRLN
jgi:hypothetical protein